MIRDTHNVVPISMAFMLHFVLFASLLVVIDFSRSAQPVMPLAIKGTLVTEDAITAPPPEVVVPPEPVASPEPDPSEQQRIAAEEAKRLEDQRIEQERLHRLAQEEAERLRKLEEMAERQRAAEEAERRRREEQEMERQRLEAERRREAEIERQRQENERARAAAEEAARREALEAESSRLEAMEANAKAAYMFAIQQSISRRWARPPTATAGLECVVNIQQVPGGEVVNVSIGSCNGDAAVRQSIEAAVHRASPLPTPSDPSVFDRNIRLIFRPED